MTLTLIRTAEHTSKFDLGRMQIELRIDGLGLFCLVVSGGIGQTGVGDVGFGTSRGRFDTGLLLPCCGGVGALAAALAFGEGCG